MKGWGRWRWGWRSDWGVENGGNGRADKLEFVFAGHYFSWCLFFSAIWIWRHFDTFLRAREECGLDPAGLIFGYAGLDATRREEFYDVYLQTPSLSVSLQFRYAIVMLLPLEGGAPQHLNG